METISANEPRLLSTRQAAKLLSLSAGTLRFWRSIGFDGPPFLRIGRSVRYDENDLRVWVKSRRVRPRKMQQADAGT
jgi:predicted DNA-binding transcriptional regulator AlpA